MALGAGVSSLATRVRLGAHRVVVAAARLGCRLLGHAATRGASAERRMETFTPAATAKCTGAMMPATGRSVGARVGRGLAPTLVLLARDSGALMQKLSLVAEELPRATVRQQPGEVGWVDEIAAGVVGADDEHV